MKKKAILPIIALVLSIVMMLGACGSKSAKVQKNELPTSKAAISIGENTYLVRAGETDESIPAEATTKTYDISVTTFNVGGFACGVDSGIHTSAAVNDRYPPQRYLDGWYRLFDKANNFANHGFTSDVYAFQEYHENFYVDDIEGGTGEIIKTDDIMANMFKQVESRKGLFNGLYDARSAIAVSNKSELSGITNVTSAHLSGKREDNSRLYVKGYINVKGIDIAVYSCHMGHSDVDGDITSDSYNELLDLMAEDEYCIVMGDMNSTYIQDVMRAAGYKSANCDKWGNFNTYTNASSNNSWIDHIFVSPNIDIEHVVSTTDDGDNYSSYYGSDHIMITAYLTINENAAGITKTDVEIGSDGYTTEYR